MTAQNYLKIVRDAQSAAERIQELWACRPKFGIVLGTGAGPLAAAIDQEMELPYSELSGFPLSTAMGHAGRFVCGKLLGQPVIAMQGRFHIYEGYHRDVSAIGIHVMAQLGVQFLLLSNAAGGLNPRFEAGEIMLITSHIDLMFRGNNSDNQIDLAFRPILRADSTYDSELIHQAERCARRCDFVVHRGTYCGLLGPNYETKAEYRFLRRIGVDTVGMSTIPEVCVAGQYGLRTLALSVVTNVAKPDSLAPTSGQEVIDAAKLAAPNLQRLFENAIACTS